MTVNLTSMFVILQGTFATPRTLLEAVLTSASLQYPDITPLEMVRNKSLGQESVHQLEVVAVLLLEPQPHLIVLQVAVNIKLTTPTQ